jgi:hypothetical protein
MRLGPQTKIALLWIITGLAVAFVRHGIHLKSALYEVLEDFFGYWLMYTVALALFVPTTAFLIDRYHTSILGRKISCPKDDLIAYVLVTVLMVTVAVLVLAHQSIFV